MRAKKASETSKYAGNETKTCENAQQGDFVPPAMSRRRFLRAGALLAGTALLGSMTGCKESDRLTEKIYNDTAELIDYDNPNKNWVNVANAKVKPLEAKKLTQAETEMMKEQTHGEYDKSGLDDAEASQQEYNDRSKNSNGEAEGTGGDGDFQEGEKGTNNGAGTGEAGSEGDGTTGTGGNTNSPNGYSAVNPSEDASDALTELPKGSPLTNDDSVDNTGDGGNGAKVYNDGKYEELPTGTSTIAATGDYALIVCMLAGGGNGFKSPLVAADEEFLSDSKIMEVFANEGVSKSTVKKAWKGDGRTEGKVDMDVLLAANPDTVLVGTDDYSLTQKQANRLKKAGINVVVMPRMGQARSQDSDVIKAVKVVGELLSQAKTRYNTASMAADYENFHRGILKKIVNANGGYTPTFATMTQLVALYYGAAQYTEDGTQTVLGTQNEISGNIHFAPYVDAWVSYSGSDVAACGTNRFEGKHYLNSEYYWMDLSDGFGAAVSRDTAYFPVYEYYLKCGGADDWWCLPQFLGYETSRIIAPTAGTDNEINLKYCKFSNGEKQSGTATVSRWCGTPPNWGYAEPYSSMLGSSDFPGVIIRDESWISHIQSGARKQNNPWYTGSAYEVYILPNGVAGTWSRNTVESFLMAPWVYCTYQQNKNYNGSCADDVSQFYQKFYRVADFRKYLDGYGTVYTIKP